MIALVAREAFTTRLAPSVPRLRRSTKKTQPIMKTPTLPSLLAVASALALMGGCATEPESHLVTAPPPASPNGTQQVVVTQQQPMVMAQPQQVVATNVAPGPTYVVMQAPPAPQPEAVPPRPSSQDVWLAGYWTWRDNRYAWMAGHWERPPTNATRWVNPRWEPENGAYRFYEGYWN